jgi:uncharacterized protein
VKYFLTTIIIFYSTFLSAQNTILWKVTNAKSQKVSYLLGTYHILGNTFVDSFPVIKEKLQASDVLITETELNRAKVAAYYNAAPSTTNLSEILSEEDVNFIKDIFKRRKVDIFKLSPGVLYMTLSGNYPKFKCGNQIDTLAFDEYLQNMAKAENKKLIYFENDSLQLVTINQMTKDFTWNNFKKVIPALLEKYKKDGGDEKECSFMKEYLSFNLDYTFKNKCSDYGAQVESRNSNWMQKIPALLENNNCFIAVGLFHLYNKCGIMEQLRQLGYTVEPVNMKNI